jgi:NAD(P)-dependent dehydrogenase (short-subunit alcohol dehydrogenase family)
MSRHELEGRLALITGAASGIGRATARHFAALGATVVVADVDEAGAGAVAHDLGAPHRAIRLDVSDRVAWSAALAELVGDGFEPDIVHLNAGVCTRPKGLPADDDPLAWVTEGNYRRVMSVNADGPVFGLMATLPHLTAAGGGDIVITSSAGGIIPMSFDPLYAMSKLGALALVWSMAPTLALLGIRLNAICPGLVDTDLLAPHERARLAERHGDTPETIAADVAAIISRGATGGAWVPDRAVEGGIRLYTPPPMFRSTHARGTNR